MTLICGDCGVGLGTNEIFRRNCQTMMPCARSREVTEPLDAAPHRLLGRDLGGGLALNFMYCQ
jgi:hypothetical protein